MRKLAFALVPIALAALPGCKGCGKGGEGHARPSVAVSIFPIYDLTKRIAGPDADVTLLLPAGRSAHSFEPTPKDVETASKARLGVMIGLDLDPWMEKLLKDAAPNAKVLKVGDRVPPPTREDASADPHVWLDPQRAQLVVRAIAEELGRVDAAHALAYRERGTELEKSLGALDKEVEDRTKAFTRRGFVTFHGAFAYFAERYGLEILAVVEPVPGTPPTSEHLQEVLDVVKTKKVPVVYGEPQLDPRPAKTISDEAKIPLATLDPLGGQPETDSYEKMIRFDVAALEKYLK